MTSPNSTQPRALFPHVIVPSWLALGATFKMLESDARLLPKSVLQTLGNLGLTEGNLLSYSLGSRQRLLFENHLSSYRRGGIYIRGVLIWLQGKENILMPF